MTSDHERVDPDPRPGSCTAYARTPVPLALRPVRRLAARPAADGPVAAPRPGGRHARAARPRRRDAGSLATMAGPTSAGRLRGTGRVVAVHHAAGRLAVAGDGRRRGR